METDNKCLNLKASFIIAFGFVIRLIYILNTTVYERGHDVGNYTSLTDGIVNPGHLGYIEYFAKFHHLPDFDPFNVFSYYHPPLHHILSSFVVRFSIFCGASTDTAFENIQFLVLFYSVVAMVLAFLILRQFSESSFILVPLFIFCIHPSMILMSGSVNNDMMTVMAELLIILLGILWIRNFEKRRLLFLLALSIGIGFCIKVSIIVMALPIGIIMLMRLISVYSKGETAQWKKRLHTLILDYGIFALISIPIGLSWEIWEALMFHEKPGIASATPESFMYMGNYPLLRRLGFPRSLGLSYPFHSVYAKASDNVWLIMFRTSVFGEIRPDVKGVSLFLCQTVFILCAIAGIFCAGLTIYCNLIEIKRGDRHLGVFMLSGYLSFILTYIAFVIKYPYTCSCDFRYIVPALLYGCVGIVQWYELLKNRDKRKEA